MPRRRELAALRGHLLTARDLALGHPRRAQRDTLALAALASLPGPFVPWSSMAMRPGAVLRLLNEVRVNERRWIVECGAGISTIYLARLLAHLGAGRLLSIESDATWAAFVRGELAEEHTEDRAAVAHVPLEAGAADGSADGLWYAPDALAAVEPDIDLLIVDGPVAYDGSDRRYPALPFFLDRLAPRCAIVLDDARRPGERAVLERWSRETGLDFDASGDDGIAVAHRGFAYAT